MLSVSNIFSCPLLANRRSILGTIGAHDLFFYELCVLFSGAIGTNRRSLNTHCKIPIQLNPFVAHAILICDFVPFSHSFWRGIEVSCPFFSFRGFIFGSCSYEKQLVCNMHYSWNVVSYMQNEVEFLEFCFRWISFCTFFHIKKMVCMDWKKRIAFSQNLLFSSTYRIASVVVNICVDVTVALSHFQPRKCMECEI